MPTPIATPRPSVRCGRKRFSLAAAPVVVMFIAVLGAGCRRHPARTVPIRPQLEEEYCWWAVLRSPLPPDSVAARFQRAFTTVGLTGATWTRSADTAWARAGPTSLGGRYAGATYESRAVAYWRGDSTHFRHYVAIGQRPEGWAPAADTVSFGGRLIGLCADIARAAAIPTSVPRTLTGEETLPVWRRRP
jgi:hypothetical protein